RRPRRNAPDRLVAGWQRGCGADGDRGPHGAGRDRGSVHVPKRQPEHARGLDLVASADPSATDTTTPDPTSTSSSDQPTTPATTVADTGPASNVATTTQPPTADSAGTSTQADATTQTALAAPAATGASGDAFVFAASEFPPRYRRDRDRSHGLCGFPGALGSHP